MAVEALVVVAMEVAVEVVVEVAVLEVVVAVAMEVAVVAVTIMVMDSALRASVITVNARATWPVTAAPAPVNNGNSNRKT